ncbi:MAG: pantoate kinase [Thermoplasmata archaeon]
MRKARAFCPGHVTAFFEVCRTRDPLSTGSRGAGICLSLGATSEVTFSEESGRSIEVTLDGRPVRAPVTVDAVSRLLGDRCGAVSVRTRHDLPVGQGFGMSAAGALSAAFALASILRESKQRAFEVAHEAEVLRGGGLGDVAALYRGGVTVRERPGLPPIGKVRRVPGAPELVLCVVGRPIRTKTVLSHPGKVRAINSIGGRLVDEMLKRPSVSTLMELANDFALASGLATKRVLRAIKAASAHGVASMAMLGNSVFAVGDVDALDDVLSACGRTYRCNVDVAGPRTV